MEIDAVMLGARCLAHFLTFLLVATYKPSEDAAKRLGVSLVACILAGSSLMLLVLGMLTWDWQLTIPLPFSFALLAQTFAFLIVIAIARGNVARLFPRIKWESSP